MKEREIRYGMIGLGWPGLNHARGLARVEGASLAAASDLSSERREAFHSEFHPRRLYVSYEELLADPEVDAVVISLPNFLHFPVTLAAIQAGKHVLCEKPPTMNLEEIETIREEVERRGVTYGFGRQLRFSTAMLAARRAVDEGKLGKVYYAKGRWLRLRGIPGGIGGWFTSKASAGGGALIDIGIHALDAAWFLAGCPKPKAVSAHIGTFFAYTVPQQTRFDVEDSAFAFIRCEGDLVISLESTWAMNLEHSAKPARSGMEIMDTILYGDAATLQMDPPSLITADPQIPAALLQTPLPVDEATVSGAERHVRNFHRQIEDFTNAVRTGTQPLNSLGQAVSLMKMLMAAYESGSTGREVRLD